MWLGYLYSNREDNIPLIISEEIEMLELIMMSKKEEEVASLPSQILFDNGKETIWTVPAGVYSISAVAVGGGGAGGNAGQDPTGGTTIYGGGGGGGGALAYQVSIPVTPGEQLIVRAGAAGVWSAGTTKVPTMDGGDSGIWRGNTALVHARGGAGALVRICGLGGVRGAGAGGSGGQGSHGSLDTGITAGGAGGAGGYWGNGGRGAYYHRTYPVDYGAGLGGAGAGATHGQYNGYGKDGGGVGVIAGVNTTVYSTGNPGSGGKGIQYGGGGGGVNSQTGPGRSGGPGAVRIIWGEGRAYPNTNTADVITT